MIFFFIFILYTFYKNNHIYNELLPTFSLSSRAAILSSVTSPVEKSFAFPFIFIFFRNPTSCLCTYLDSFLFKSPLILCFWLINNNNTFENKGLSTPTAKLMLFTHKTTTLHAFFSSIKLNYLYIYIYIFGVEKIITGHYIFNMFR